MSERKSCSLRELACVLECDEEIARSTLEKILQRKYLSNINYDGQRGLLVAVGVASNVVIKRRCTTCGALLPDATAKCVHCGTRLRH
jgi:ribosomal protein L40E